METYRVLHKSTVKTALILRLEAWRLVAEEMLMPWLGGTRGEAPGPLLKLCCRVASCQTCSPVCVIPSAGHWAAGRFTNAFAHPWHLCASGGWLGGKAGSPHHWSKVMLSRANQSSPPACANTSRSGWPMRFQLYSDISLLETKRCFSVLNS